MAADSKKIVTRFAPSPTGFLHIGGARTALFNWLYARGRDGAFLLRIEDTDRKRSTQDAIDAILEGLRWLGLDWDGDPVFQSRRQDHHAEAVERLLKAGKAYKCYASQEELQEMREQARARGEPMRYDGRWRDRDPADAPAGIDPVIRLKTPQEGETVIEDRVQGTVKVPNRQLDDMVLVRSDGSPTYMLSVVVDDHDMGITNVIRGDDHLTNAFRQKQIYNAFDWDAPEFAHIPLIHGPDGKKLSKRHGALGVESYKEMGFLPAAMRNYLARLGWGYKDHEIFTSDQAREWFTLEAVGRGPARFDTKKLENLNGFYIRHSEDRDLVEKTLPFLEGKLGRSLEKEERKRLLKAMPGLKERAKTLIELADSAQFYFLKRPLPLTEKAKKLLGGDVPAMLGSLVRELEKVDDWQEETLLDVTRSFAEKQGLKLGKVAQPMRAALTGSHVSPSVFDIMAVMGPEESMNRLKEHSKQER